MAEVRSYLAPHEGVKASIQDHEQISGKHHIEKGQRHLLLNLNSLEDSHQPEAGRDYLGDSVLSDVGMQPLLPTTAFKGGPLIEPNMPETVHRLVQMTLPGQHDHGPLVESEHDVVENLEKMMKSSGQSDALNDVAADDFRDWGLTLKILSDHCASVLGSADPDDYVEAILRAKHSLSDQSKCDIVEKLREGLAVPLSNMSGPSDNATQQRETVSFDSDTALGNISRPSGHGNSQARASHQPVALWGRGPGVGSADHVAQATHNSHDNDSRDLAEGYRLQLAEVRDEFLTMKHELSIILVDKVFVNQNCGWCEQLRDLLMRKVYPSIQD